MTVEDTGAALAAALRTMVRDIAGLSATASVAETAAGLQLQLVRAELRERNQAYGRASDTIGRLRGECARLRERIAELEATRETSQQRTEVDYTRVAAADAAIAEGRSTARTLNPPEPMLTAGPLGGSELLHTLIELILPTYGHPAELGAEARLDAQDDAVYMAEQMRRRGLVLTAREVAR